MKPLPETDDSSLLLRTDFADDNAWETLCARVSEPVGEFRAYVTPVSDRAYAHASIEDIVGAAAGGEHTFVFVADKEALASAEHAMLFDFANAVDDDGVFRGFPDPH